VNWTDDDPADRTSHPEEHFNKFLEVGPNPNDLVVKAFFFHSVNFLILVSSTKSP
jgi:hypothetical protein